MDNGDFQMLVLDQLAKMNKRLDFFEHRMDSAHNCPDSIQDRLTGIEGQTKEMTDSFISLQRRLEVVAAKLDKLPKTPASKELSPVTKEEFTIINETQQLHGEWLRVLSADTAQLKAELHRLKPAK